MPAEDDAERSDEESGADARRRRCSEAMRRRVARMIEALFVPGEDGKGHWGSRDDLSSIRTGQANPGMFARIAIDYGSITLITQLSSIHVPGPHGGDQAV